VRGEHRWRGGGFISIDKKELSAPWLLVLIERTVFV
jgi:hypothetical protein